jgi:hypothetical protein
MGEQRHKGEFVSSYSDEQLYGLIRKVAALATVEPRRLSQALFDSLSAKAAAALEYPEPPTARAIYMRFEKKRSGEVSWRSLVEGVVSVESVAMKVAFDKAEAPADDWLDERGVVYALKRVALSAGKKTLTPYQYDAVRSELLSSRYAALVLPTSGQITAATETWAYALALAGLEQPSKHPAPSDTVKLLWHCYETQARIPTEVQLREYVNKDLCLSLPKRKIAYREYIEQLRQARAERGWATDKAGPEPGERLTGDELAELIADARRATLVGSWTRERVLEAFIEFVGRFHGRQDLTTRLYKNHRVEENWPSQNGYESYGTFNELKAEALRAVQKRAKKAA